MKVICVDSTPLPNRPLSPLVEGNQYTIQRLEPTDKGKCYILHETLEWQESYRIAFEKYRFMPVSEIDETTFERNYNKELV